jgi:hypothetical protein
MRCVAYACAALQAEANVQSLNRIQELLGLQPYPRLENLRAPATLHTVKHLTAWFDEWIKVYELLPHIVDPEPAAAAPSEGDSDAAQEDGGDEGEEPAAAEGSAAEGAAGAMAEDAAGGTADGAEGAMADGGGRKGAGGRADAQQEGKVKLTPEQVEEVRAAAELLQARPQGSRAATGLL